MTSDRLKMPPQRDYCFYQPKKHDKWRVVEPPDPALEAPVADTHAHIHMLPNPFWELERAAANGVQLVGCVADPTEDAIEDVFSLAAHDGSCGVNPTKGVNEGIFSLATHDDSCSAASNTASNTASNKMCLSDTFDDKTSMPETTRALPRVVFTFGVHPHNAKDYSPEVETQLIEALSHPNARVLGEIGLDYHYDLSPRDVQRDAFRQQIRLAHKLGLPISLHLRSGENAETDNAHQEAFEILQEEGFPERGTLLHCCSLDADQLRPWVEADCYIAYGGAFTFNNSDDAREAAHLVSRDRLLLETDAPFMTPVPMRGATCTPAHVVFTAAAVAEELGTQPGPEREALLEDIWANSKRFFAADVL